MADQPREEATVVEMPMSEEHCVEGRSVEGQGVPITLTQVPFLMKPAVYEYTRGFRA